MQYENVTQKVSPLQFSEPQGNTVRMRLLSHNRHQYRRHQSLFNMRSYIVSHDVKKDILDQLKHNEALRKEIIHSLAREYPTDFLSRIKIEPTRVSEALKGVVVSCKEWQE
jgi:hypothetical protein